ncbi:MAG TPA: sigma-70 family RNA polymerase sigma factor [Planctomycetota bacterium]
MSDPRVDALLEHAGWVRALAASLCRDPGLAEDIVQETWLSALRRGPQDQRSLRGWLATVLRRHLRQARRGEERRARRESARPRAPDEPAPGDVIERAESHRDLVEAVLELREPFRTTVLLRYLEELAPDEVAARQGVPVATVHSRLARGLAALRARYGEDPGVRPTLACALLWLDAGRGPVAARLLARALAPAAAVVAALGLGGLAWSLAGASGDRRALPDVAGLSSAAPGERPPAATHAAREPVPSVSVPAPREAAPVALHAGLVLDRTGEPLGGVPIALLASGSATVAATFTSAADGRFAFPEPEEPVELVAAGPEHATVLAALAAPGRTAEACVVVAPALTVAGHVRAEDGAPIEGAALTLWIDPYLPVSSLLALDFSRHERRGTVSDAAGAFRIGGLPAIPEALLEVSAPGFVTRNVRVPQASGEDLALVLRRPEGTPLVRGVVRAARGGVVAGALVSAAPAETRTDAAGVFELALCPAPLHARLVALVPGGAAVAETLATDAGDAPLWPEWIELVLPERSGVLTGHVRTRAGRALAGARVWLADPTLARTRPDGPRYAEALAADPEAPAWRWVETDAQGAFRLEGLLAREYLVQAVDPGSLGLAEGRAAPGDALELVFEEPLHTLAGRVRDRAGRGIEGVELRPGRPLFRDPLDGRAFSEGLSLASVRSAADGSFALPVPLAAGALLHARSDAIFGDFFVVGELGPAAQLVVDRRVHFRVELADPEHADAFELLDADGQALPLAQVREGRSMLQYRGLIAGTRSLVLAVSDAACTLVLYRRGEEVGRRAIALSASELEVLRW